MSEKTNASSGIGFTGILQIVFIVLKLLGKISWSWFWVLSPAIFSAGIFVIIIVIYLIVIATKL
jgi:hypothetical protein